MAGVQDLDEREDYFVRVIEFAADTASTIDALQRVFGLNETDARAMLREVPVAVRRDVNRIRAEYFRRALELSGARVEVCDGQGAVVVPAAQVAAGRSPLRAASAGVQPPAPSSAAASEPLAAGRTLVFGSLPLSTPSAPSESTTREQNARIAGTAANDTTDASAPGAEGWGDFQPFKQPPPAVSAPSVPRPSARQGTSPAGAFAVGGPRELSASDMPGPGGFGDGSQARLSTSELPAAAAGAGGAGTRGPLELTTSDLPAGPQLELGVEEPDMVSHARKRDAGARYEPIPAGGRWKAPDTDTVTRARGKHDAKSLESSLSDARSFPMPPGRQSAAEPRHASDRSKPRVAGSRSATPAPRPRTTKSQGFGEVARLAFGVAAMRWTAWIVVACGALAGAGELCKQAPWVGAPLVLVCAGFLLAVCGLYHRHVFWAAATAEHTLVENPSFEIAVLARSALPLTLFVGLTQALLWGRLVSELTAGHSALAIISSPIVWVLGFGPGFYWSIALGCAAARNRFSAVWDFSQGLRALGRVPGEFARIALATGGVFVGALWLVTTGLSAFGIDGPAGLLIATGLPLALSHALLGAWTGRLLHRRPDVFE